MKVFDCDESAAMIPKDFQEMLSCLESASRIGLAKISMLNVFRYGYCWKCFFVFSENFDPDVVEECEKCFDDTTSDKRPTRRDKSYNLTFDSIIEHVRMVIFILDLCEVDSFLDHVCSCTRIKEKQPG